ncbi:MAG: hypothetical protein MJZ75_02155 [Paludibacteraceae bacterium]|nr:hypothetical protein [Paludibacteraceae bacterium]
MKKPYKIAITVASVVLLAVLVVALTNRWLEVLVHRQLDQNIATADSLRISYGEIDVSAFTGEAFIRDVYFCSDTLPFSDTATHTVLQARVEQLSLDGINYYDWLIRRQLHLKGLTITQPHITTRFFHSLERAEGQQLDSIVREQRKQRLEDILSIARIFIDDAVVHRITIDGASIDASAYNDSFRLSVPECTVSIYDLGYNIRDRLPHYNDSVFHFLFRDVDMYIPDAHLSLSVDTVRAQPQGGLEIANVQIHSQLDSLGTEYIDAGVRKIRVGGFDVAKFNTVKQMDIRDIHFDSPYATMCIDENKDAASSRRRHTTQEEMAQINDKLQQANMSAALEFITGLVVDTIFIHNAEMDVQSSTTAFCLHTDSVSFVFCGVGYSLIDEIPYHYNDSVYSFALRRAEIVTPDSLLSVVASDIRYDNGGSFSMGKTRIRHLPSKWDLAHRMGDIPASWIDLTVNNIHTSSKNIVKEAFSLEQGFFLDTLYADVQSLKVFRDSRFQPKQPYQLPQAALVNLTYPFVIHRVNAKVHSIHVETALTEKSVGVMNLGYTSLTVNNVTAIPNSTIHVLARCRVGKGSADARFDMTVNPSCDWRIALRAQNLDLHFLDGMVYPLVGMKIGCDISRLTADYHGDKLVAEGTFCMEYDNLDIRAFRENDSPFTVVGNLSGLINSVGKTLVNKRNPARPGQAPLSYRITWKNDVWSTPALFFVGPVINGSVETLLPGLFIHNRVKKN